MSNMISVTNFRSHVSDVVNRVHYKNETIFLTRGSTVVAKIVGVEPSYPYAREIKAARIKAKTFLQAVVDDISQLIQRAARRGALGAKFLMEKAWEGVLLALGGLRRWIVVCFNFEKEVWGTPVVRRRRVRTA